MRRMGAITFLALSLLFCPWPASLQAAAIFVNANQPLGPVNQLVFGNAEPFGHGNSLFESDSFTFHPQVLTLVSALKPTVLRFLGSDFYFWEDGIGPHHLRPEPRPSQYDAFGGDGANRGFDYGTDEHMTLCEQIGAEAFICVNYGTGILEDTLSTEAPLSQRVGRAADWVEYCNGPNDGSNPNGGVDWAARRAENGHPEPYKVKYWEIGNEIYGYWSNSPVDESTYAWDFISFSQAMKAVDPDIKIGAAGTSKPHWRRWWEPGSPEWNATVLSIAHQHIDFLAVHCHYPGTTTITGEDLYRAGLAAARQVRRDLIELRSVIDQFDASIDIVLGENGFNTGKENWGEIVTSLLAGLHFADLRMLFLEQNSDLNISFACGWTLHSRCLSGDIAHKLSPERRFARPEYYAQLMFREHFGEMLVANTVDCSTFCTVEVGQVQAMSDVSELSVCTSIDSAGTKLYLMVINRQLDQDVEATIQLSGFEPQARAHVWTLNGPTVVSHNEDDPNTVTIIPSTFAPAGTSFTYNFPAHSLTAIELRRPDPPRLENAESDPSRARPSSYRLWQNFPNPFNGSTNIRFHLPRGGPVALRVYNLLGQLVKTLAQELHLPGEHQVFWDGTNNLGEQVASGVYFCHIQAGEYREACKMTLLR